MVMSSAGRYRMDCGPKSMGILREPELKKLSGIIEATWGFDLADTQVGPEPGFAGTESLGL